MFSTVKLEQSHRISNHMFAAIEEMRINTEILIVLIFPPGCKVSPHNFKLTFGKHIERYNNISMVETTRS